MTPDLAFGRKLVLLLAAVTGAFFGMGLGFRVAPSLLFLYPWIIPLWAAGGAVLGIVLALAVKRSLGRVTGRALRRMADRLRAQRGAANG